MHNNISIPLENIPIEIKKEIENNYNLVSYDKFGKIDYLNHKSSLIENLITHTWELSID